MYFRLWMALILFFMTSCSSYQQFIDHSKTMKSCKMTCQAQLKQCNLSCRNNCKNCTDLANAEAAVHFNQYKTQQRIQGKIVALELQSFRDPLKCRKTTCACPADFAVCIQSCKGRIRKNLQVVAPC